jgi:hypothetical protein
MPIAQVLHLHNAVDLLHFAAAVDCGCWSWNLHAVPIQYLAIRWKYQHWRWRRCTGSNPSRHGPMIVATITSAACNKYSAIVLVESKRISTVVMVAVVVDIDPSIRLLLMMMMMMLLLLAVNPIHSLFVPSCLRNQATWKQYYPAD